MKETAQAFKKAIIDEFDDSLKRVGFKKIRHRANKDGFSIIYGNAERYISFRASLDPRDYPFLYAISFGEDSNDFPASGWNRVSIFLFIKSKSLADFERSKEVFSIEYGISSDQILEKVKASHELLDKYGKSFLENDLDEFRRLRAEQNKNR